MTRHDPRPWNDMLADKTITHHSLARNNPSRLALLQRPGTLQNIWLAPGFGPPVSNTASQNTLCFEQLPPFQGSCKPLLATLVSNAFPHEKLSVSEPPLRVCKMKIL